MGIANPRVHIICGLCGSNKDFVYETSKAEDEIIIYLLCKNCASLTTLDELIKLKESKMKSEDRFYELIERIKKDLDDDERFSEQLEWIKKMIEEYSKRLNLTRVEILEAFEQRRSYWSANYYQKANFPKLDDKVVVFETLNELHEKFPSKKFKCCICGGITTNPYECNSGNVIEDNKVCDWKTYGLFKTMGKGFRFTVKESFLQKPLIDEIFMPIELLGDKEDE